MSVRQRVALPIDDHLPAVVTALREGSSLVLVAEPGAGKTTRVPAALLDAGLASDGEIVVLEPRRIAARMAARRIASELGEEVGKRIGYQIRFDERTSKQTRVRFVTEGVLTRKLVQDPQLRGVSVVILDEFHERHLQGDVGLALLRRLQRTSRPELKLVVMSATLQAGPVAAYLGCEVVQTPGRTHPVEISYSDPGRQRLEQHVAGTLSALVKDGLDGDVLVFLPGAAEIRRCRERCDPIAKRAGIDVAALHGDLPANEQDRAVTRGDRPKLILSTNVAESSLTIEGVTTVIDSGLARVAGHSPFSGLPTLNTAPISQASATQRAGRAGRVRAGRCVRLYTKHDHGTRRHHDRPEIERLDLTETLLGMLAMGVELQTDDWLTPPPPPAWDAAGRLLGWLGALQADLLTELGRRMARVPMHPRLARILVEAENRGVPASGCTLTALLSERDIWRGARARLEDRTEDLRSGPSDPLDRLERFEIAEARGFDGGIARAEDLDVGALHAVKRVRDQLSRANRGHDEVESDSARDEALQISLLAGFGDRVAQRRAPGGEKFVFAISGACQQSSTSVVRDASLAVVLDASERTGKQRGVVAHQLSAVEPEWLLELFGDRIADESQLRFDEKRQRVVESHTLRFENLVLDDVQRDTVEDSRAEEMLYDAARAHGVERLWDADALSAYIERVAHVASLDGSVPRLPADAIELALISACVGRSGFAELRELSLLDELRAQLPAAAAGRVEALAPREVQLPSGRRLPVHYERDRPPWVQSRLQDFFGMGRGPAVGDQPLVLHLLAPNQRAVQVTSDLAGFWDRHYPEQRKQLMRRYPKHDWPQDPRTATPPPPARPRAGKSRKK